MPTTRRPREGTLLGCSLPGPSTTNGKGLRTSGGSRLGVGHAIGLGIEQDSEGSGGGCRSLSHKWRSFCGDYLAAFATKR